MFSILQYFPNISVFWFDDNDLDKSFKNVMNLVLSKLCYADVCVQDGNFMGKNSGSKFKK